MEEYTRLNNGFLAKHSITDPLFVSKYAPLLILSVTKEELYILEKDDMVFSLDLFVNLKAESELVIANKMSKAEVVRDSYGNKGAGVKIGQIEDGVPSITGSELANASITCYSTCCGNTFHATCVAKILVGQTNGVAPQADLYCTDYCDSLSFYPGVEWLLSQGVNIINMSAQLLDPQGNDHLSPEGKYETGCKWVDHIAIEHDVHFVKSAGNRGLTPEGSDGDCLITCPGMAYNVITVGGFDDWNDENAVNDCMSSSTSYEESLGSHRAEKPNMVAAESIEGFGAGTSFAAPQVAGVIAQLCSYESSLKTKQSIMGAILAAGSTIKVTGINHGSKNGRFNTSDTFTINPQISDKEGAGKLNAKDARTVVKNGKYWKKTINADSFPYTQNVYISSANNTLIRVAVFWLKRNSLSSSDHTNTSMTEPPFSNLDLKVYAPDGSLIDTSETDWSSFEIVQFKPTQTGYYQIVISKTGTNSSTKEYVGIAVW